MKSWGPSFEILAGLKVGICLHIIKMPAPFTSFMKGAHSGLLNEPHMARFSLCILPAHSMSSYSTFLPAGYLVIPWPVFSKDF